MSAKQSFVLFSVAPVQEFLAAARRTQDLFAGSRLLSYLVSSAMNKMIADGGEMIYPFMQESELQQQTHLSIPNRFLCRHPGKISDAEKSCVAAAEEMQNQFSAISNRIRQQFKLEQDDVWRQYWQQQISNFLEINYVCIQAEKNDSYTKILQELDDLLGSRKLVRDFDELSYRQDNKLFPGQPGVKCSLFANLSAVHPANTSANEFWREQVLAFPGIYRRNERLSAVAVTKRRFPQMLKASGHDDDVSFPSTTTIAAGGFYRALLRACTIDQKLQQAVQQYDQAMFRLHNSRGTARSQPLPAFRDRDVGPAKQFMKWDADWLHPEQYTERRLRDTFGDLNAELSARADSVKQARNGLFKRIRPYNQNSGDGRIPALAKYYAVILFDGDKIGETIQNGLADHDFDDALQKHGEISRSLRSFAAETVKDILEGTGTDGNPRLGALVYAGGDDVLALCALDDLLPVLDDMRSAFVQMMATTVDNPTASAGVTITQHQASLQQALQQARNAVHFAKDSLLRDAVAFALMKRSGEHYLTGAKWSVDAHATTPLVLNEFAKLITNGCVSQTFVYEFELESYGMEFRPEDGLDGMVVDALFTEFKRVLKRHTKPDMRSEVAAYVDERIRPLFQQLQRLREQRRNAGQKPVAAIRQLMDLLQVAQFVGRGGKND